MRKRIVAANWKMNKTPAEAKEFLKLIKKDISGSSSQVYIIPPFVDLDIALNELTGTDVLVGAQNIFYEDSGAYTGEISAPMLKSMGVKAVVIGHSERRMYFKEDDEIVNKKIKKAIEHGLTPIICCGESLEIRESEKTSDWIEKQIENAFTDIKKEDVLSCIIAYEPIWAIGTGKVATTLQAQEICKLIRKKIKSIYGEAVGEAISILYGGSVNASNCKELFECDDIDGGLIGGAGLKPEFIEIVNC